MTEPVIVVAGLPRSGTSMMMQILAAGGLDVMTDNVRQSDVDNPKGYYEFEPVKKLASDASWLNRAGGKVVKMVYRLLYDLPATYQYRVVFMQRNLDEVIASQEAMLQRNGKPTTEIEPHKLANMYRRQLDDVERWLATQPNFSVLYVNYHDVLDKPSEIAQRLNGFLGGHLDREAMSNVPSRELYRQRR